MSVSSLRKMIHVGCKQLGLDNDTRRDLQLLATGKASMSDMTELELGKVIKALKSKGFKTIQGSKAKRPAAKRGDVRFAHVLWRRLSEHGAAHTAGPAGLNAFIRARFEQKWGAVPIDIDTMTDWAQIADVIDALKAWCKREGVELDA
jgi:phage gp16-like protein